MTSNQRIRHEAQQTVLFCFCLSLWTPALSTSCTFVVTCNSRSLAASRQEPSLGNDDARPCAGNLSYVYLHHDTSYHRYLVQYLHHMIRHTQRVVVDLTLAHCQNLARALRKAKQVSSLQVGTYTIGKRRTALVIRIRYDMI